MTRFYHHLRAGLGKDLALREAQLELLRGEHGLEPQRGSWLVRLLGRPDRSGGMARDYSHPYHWASFQLLGDRQ